MKIAVASKHSKARSKDESFLNKSSNDNATNSDNNDDSESSSQGHSDVFVRTKAVNHNTSSMDEPPEDGYDTMKHNKKNIIASG